MQDSTNKQGENMIGGRVMLLFLILGIAIALAGYSAYYWLLNIFKLMNKNTDVNPKKKKQKVYK